MKAVYFETVPIDSWFVYNTWLFQKMNHELAMPMGYAASNSFKGQEVVNYIQEKDLEILAKAAPVQQTTSASTPFLPVDACVQHGKINCPACYHGK